MYAWRARAARLFLNEAIKGAGKKKVAMPKRDTQRGQLQRDVIWKSILNIIRWIITSGLHKYGEREVSKLCFN